jgi:hypothetical protein
LLDRFTVGDVAVEVTHLSARRLFGLKGLAPLRAVVQPTVHPDPNREPGRTRHETVEDITAAELPSLPPVSPIDRPALDYCDHEHWMAHLDQTIQQTRRALQTLASPVIESASTDPRNGVAIPAASASEPAHDDEHMDHDV